MAPVHRDSSREDRGAHRRRVPVKVYKYIHNYFTTFGGNAYVPSGNGSLIVHIQQWRHDIKVIHRYIPVRSHIECQVCKAWELQSYIYI